MRRVSAETACIGGFLPTELKLPVLRRASIRDAIYSGTSTGITLRGYWTTQLLTEAFYDRFEKEFDSVQDVFELQVRLSPVPLWHRLLWVHC